MRTLFELDKKDHALCRRTFRRDSARGVIIKNGVIAMVHSLKYDYYKFPGGGIEKGETPVDAVVRETREEAGLVVIPGSVKEYGVVRRVQKSAKDPDVRFMQDNYYFFCRCAEETAEQDLDGYESDERFTLEFVAPEKAISVNRAKDHGPKDRLMIEREARVLELLVSEGYFGAKDQNGIYRTEENEMDETVARLVAANKRYSVSGALTGDFSASRRAENANGQKPYAVIVTCSDSRVVPEAIFSAGIGELFVVRTAGNVVGDAELASVVYAVEHLRARTVIVLGHTCCGAVHAALCGEFEGPVGVVTRRIKAAAGEETDERKACELNVKEGVEIIKNALAAEKATVVGAVYDTLSGKVEMLGNITQG